MADLTLEEKMASASGRAKELEAEKHFFELNQPHYPLGFSVTYRNPGHWDVMARECPGRVQAFYASHPGGRTSAQDGQSEREFRIRGQHGHVLVFDERWNPHHPYPRHTIAFNSITAAMLWICEELMQEPASTGGGDGA